MKATLVPGWAASNCWPSVVKACWREAAANTVIVPDRAGEPDSEAGDFVGDAEGMLAEPHPARRKPVVAVRVRVSALRRIFRSKVEVRGCRLVGQG